MMGQPRHGSRDVGMKVNVVEIAHFSDKLFKCYPEKQQCGYFPECNVECRCTQMAFLGNFLN